MKTILYLGNKLAAKGKNPTTIDTLSVRLSEKYEVIVKSEVSNQVLRFLDMLLGVWRWRRRVCLVLIDTYSTKAFYFAYGAAVLCRLFRIPYVPILHGGNLGVRYERSPGKVRSLLNGARHIVAPSAFLGRFFTARGYEVLSIPNFVQVGDYPFFPRQRLSPKLLYVRALQEIYHPEMAVEVLALVRDRYPEATLCMIGPDLDGSRAHCEIRAEELGVADGIEFTGRLNRSDWHLKSRQYDVFINTTRVDNTPVSVIEAMALGLLVVSTDAGGIPDLIEDGVDGWLTPVGDASRMAEVILAAIEHPGPSLEITRKARHKAESYDWGVVKEQWSKLIDGC